MLAPICLFTYNRLTETQQSISALQQNFLASESNLIIFSDGGKNEISWIKVNEVRAYLKTVTGFKSINIIESAVNKGLANSIIDGVSQIINEFEKVIVLEDDLITTPNFLDFMNQSLDFYSQNKEVFSISGYSFNLLALKKYDKDFYLGYRASSWGWATWKNKWIEIDWAMKDYNSFRFNLIDNLKFSKGGIDLPYMLWKQMNGKIDSWAIRWCYHQFKNKSLTIFPSISKLRSIGFGNDATHTQDSEKFDTTLDDTNKRIFYFDQKIVINKIIVKQFRSKFFILKNIRSKIFNI